MEMMRVIGQCKICVKTCRVIDDAVKNQGTTNPINKVFDEKHMIFYIFHDAIVQSEIRHQTFKSKWSTKEKLKVFTEEKYNLWG